MLIVNERSIKSLLEDIENEKIGLPEIQREYVWSAQKARDLIDSLYKDFPVGVVMLWKPSSITNYRALEGNEKNVIDPDWLILDGQQRLTSLQKINDGEIKIRFDIINKTFGLENRANLNDPHSLRIDDIWNKGTHKIINELAEKSNSPSNDVFNNFGESISKIESTLHQKLTVHEIRHDDYSRITEMYVRINEKGTKLKKAEINLALIILKFPNVFHKRLRQLVDDFNGWELDTNFFLRCFVAISTNQSKFEPLKNYLQTADEKTVLNNLDNISENLTHMFNFLTSHFGINVDNNEKLIPSNNALIPLMMYFVKTNGKISTKNDIDNLSKWFFMASHYSRYSSSPETALNEDLKLLQENTTLVPLQDKISNDRGGMKMRELRGKINKTNRFALYFAIRKNNALDWWTGTKIENTIKIEFHHIFPKKILRDANYSDVMINDIRNIAIVSKKANGAISSMYPINYFPQEIGDMDRVYSQFVSHNDKLWDVKNYKNFLKDRGNKIISFINEQLENH